MSRKLDVIQPLTGERLRSYPIHNDTQVEEALQNAANCFQEWRMQPVSERVKPLRRAASILRERRQELARLMAEEMGKPIREGELEIEKCAWCCDHYAENAEHFLAPVVVESDASRSSIHYEALGIVLAIMPWNFPFWQVFRFLAPTLSAGNAGLLKHASNVPGCSLAIENVVEAAGFPKGLFRSLLIDAASAHKLIEDPRIVALSFTGSTPAGRAVAATAGRSLKKVVLELGGSDPSVILADADLSLAVDACTTSRMINAGQSCIAAKRFIVVPEIRERFERDLVERMRSIRSGDPLDPETQLGPMARRDLRDDLHDQVQRSLAAGARLLLGGVCPEDAGAHYPATVLTDVFAGVPAYEEELFGPVAAILPATDESDALRIANDTEFGLGAAVYTNDTARGEYIATKLLAAGSCFVNAFVRSDPRLPFGGIKGSGFGRELGRQGIHEFVNVKTVYLA